MKKVLIPTKLDKVVSEILSAKGFTVVQDMETPFADLAKANAGSLGYPLVVSSCIVGFFLYSALTSFRRICVTRERTSYSPFFYRIHCNKALRRGYRHIEALIIRVVRIELIDKLRPRFS